jgi:hypothetical protein
MARLNIQQHNNSNRGGGTQSREVATPEPEAGLGEEDALGGQETWKWDADPNNPYNWPTKWKIQQVLMIASAAFTT